MMLWLTMTNVLIAVTAALLFGLLVYRALPVEQRAYMDPVPRNVRFIWPLVRIMHTWVVPLLASDYVDRQDDRLRQTGLGFVFSGAEFVALQISLLLVLGLGAGLWGAMVGMSALGTAMVGAGMAAALPFVWISDMRDRRRKAVIRALPVFLDYLNLAVGAGLNLSGAITRAVEKSPEGPLRNEFSVVLRDLRAGVPRAQAMERMAERLNLEEVTQLVRALIQAEKRGTSMHDVLMIQSEQNLTRRFQRAEKNAMEAPVKLTGPLVLFIFPVTFIVLLYPIVIKMISSGAF